jgi:hypothetical protein
MGIMGLRMGSGWPWAVLICVIVLSFLTDNTDGKTKTREESSSRRRRPEPEFDEYTSSEAKLLSVIFGRYKSYKKLARPVLNASSTMKVDFGISLIQILDFDEKNQMLSTLVWKKYQWKDEILTWDPKKYGGVDTIRLPAEKIWTPDIILYNNVGSPDVERHKDLMVVSSDGTVVWVPPVKYSSSCVVDMTDFPFDIQNCQMRFGSWSYDQKRLDPVFIKNREEIIIDDYVPNSEWEILTNAAIKHVIKYPCCEFPYADLTFKLVLKRKVTFHLRLILIPTVLLSAMSIAIFWIPPNRPDRTSIGLSLFSSFFLLLILIVNSSPATEDSSLGQYYIVIILMVSTGILLSVSNINISTSTRNMPVNIEKFFINWLGVLLCNRCKNLTPEEEALKRCDVEDINGRPDTNRGEHVALHEKPEPKTPKKTQSQLNQDKWLTFSLVLDRIFFMVALTVLIISFITIFPHPLRLFTL